MVASPETSNFFELSTGRTAVLYPAYSAGHKAYGPDGDSRSDGNTNPYETRRLLQFRRWQMQI